MLEELTKQLTPVLVDLFLVIITTITGIITKKITAYFSTKQQYVVANTTAREREEVMKVGKMIWNIVEEKWRITENAEELVTTKSEMFDQLLMKKFPHLTKEQINNVRQALAGEFNKGKETIEHNWKESNSLDTENEDLKLETSPKEENQ